MDFKILVVFGILSLISAHEAISEEIKMIQDGIAPSNSSGLLRETWVIDHNMDEVMISNVQAAIHLALAMYTDPLERVRYINNTLRALYPNKLFNIIEQFAAYHIEYDYFASIVGFDLNNLFIYYIIFY